MALFDNGKPEEFLLFVQDFKMTLKAMGKIASNEKIHCLCMILYGAALCQFDTFCYQVGITTISHLKLVILGLGT